MLSWEDLYKTCNECHNCSLHLSRTNMVFGRGNKNADIMLIGEGPGQQEDLTGEPFVGRSGKLLDEMLSAAGFTSDELYIANIVKCRPENNRDPLPEEQDACIGYLKNQIWLIKPKIIVCVGRISAVKFIKDDFKISKEHGNWFKLREFLITAVYHPAALLRNPNLIEDTKQDLVNIKKMQIKLSQVPPV